MCFCELVSRVMPCADLLVSLWLYKYSHVDHVFSFTKMPSSIDRCVSVSVSLEFDYIL
jgi:hypothetical protein